MDNGENSSNKKTSPKRYVNDAMKQAPSPYKTLVFRKTPPTEKSESKTVNQQKKFSKKKKKKPENAQGETMCNNTISGTSSSVSNDYLYSKLSCSIVKKPHGTVYRKKIYDNRLNCINIRAFISVDENCEKVQANVEKKVKVKNAFEPFIPLQEVLFGIDNNTYVKGLLRINSKCVYKCFVTDADNEDGQDYLISTAQSRNAAFDGDLVVIKPDKNKRLQCSTAKVVHILQKNHSRLAVGVLRKFNTDLLELKPRDKRIPSIRIHTNTVVPIKHHLYLASITEWICANYATGVVIEDLGPSDDIEVEKRAIYLELGLDLTILPDTLIESDRKPIDGDYRRDLRQFCIFTIDPATAKDLDDAISCKPLPNGNIEVGVHIADVSAFLPIDTELNRKVERKATTTYLVEQAYHMLPLKLCQECSLLPGHDKFTFSVIWEMNTDAEIIYQTITRSQIHSCAQLAYEQANDIILTGKFQNSQPEICNNYSVEHVSSAILRLYKISKKLREKRLKDGWISIEQIKVSFKSLQPLRYEIEKRGPAHLMIEDLMLLANVSVANCLTKNVKELAFLRRHPAPKRHQIQKLQCDLERLNVVLDVTDSTSLRDSLYVYRAVSSSHSLEEQGLWYGLNHLLAKCMRRAQYFCTGALAENLNGHHYALSTPLYTHFTSPIRRYSDIVVHRLLAAALGYCDIPDDYKSVDHLQKIAHNCNMKKSQARHAEELSRKLYLEQFVALRGPLTEYGVIVDVRDNYADALLLTNGYMVQICYMDSGDIKIVDNYKGNTEKNDTTEINRQITIVFGNQSLGNSLQIQMFSIVRLKIRKRVGRNQLEAVLLSPACVST